ncbi:MAG: efflux RND transporter periplasmic adaptor subunit [Verrucomicrobiae bacterium]|nr:efflux RND transporter periplasmic adaptor subunit [Verrucomicrobiae bacterium]
METAHLIQDPVLPKAGLHSAQSNGFTLRWPVNRNPAALGLMRLASGGVAFLITIALPGCTKHEPGAQRTPVSPTLVRIAPVESTASVSREVVVGTIKARDRATVEAKVSGRITKLNATLGQTVSAGEVLCELDVQEIKARLDQARAQSEQASKDLQRYANLLSHQAVTRAEYDAVEARSRMAAAAAAEAETMLGYARVTAPFSGVITRKFADVGELAAPGRPIVEIENPENLQAEIDIPESLLHYAKPGTKLQVLHDQSSSHVEGVVTEVAPAADPVSRTHRIKMDLPRGCGLRPGQFVRVAIQTSESQCQVVPSSAIVTRGQLELVFVVTNNIAQLRLVRTGKQVGDRIEVVSGLSTGELVVIENAHTLVDGQPVQVK